jgi:gamma-glutamyltranspeptidase/glutathione hydrolase
MIFRSLLGFIILAIFQGPAAAEEKATEFRNGVVVSVAADASDAGLAVLKAGGNAVDAAVATAFALAVVHPAAGNIGGGGFMVIYPAKGEPAVIDYRETAPAAASKNMFTKDTSLYSHRVVGVPGTVRGLALVHQRFGKLPWKTLVQPAVQLAGEGFRLDAHQTGSLNGVLAAGRDMPELQRVFARPDGRPWSEGDKLVQRDLAKTLRLISDQGADGFYQGSIAELLAAEMKAGGGLITKDDLAKYQAVERKPIHGSYRGYDVYGPPPPSSGGICLVEMLNMLENFDLKKNERFAPETLHFMIEAMRRAYYDRALYLGDPAFTTIPARLATKEYAKMLAGGIDLKHATRSAELAKEIPLAPEGDSTTHFSIIDKNGMAVANTYTLERSYGSRIVVRGAGFLLNNEMMDFNWQPGVTNKQGVIGTAANQIAPGKRMLSSMTPTILSKNGKVFLVTGSPGSRTIINTVLNIVVSVIDHDMDIQKAVDAPRLHHQWFPDEVRFEGISSYPNTVVALRAMGHQVLGTRQGDAHSIWVNPRTGGYVGAADRRLSGKAAGF